MSLRRPSCNRRDHVDEPARLSSSRGWPPRMFKLQLSIAIALIPKRVFVRGFFRDQFPCKNRPLSISSTVAVNPS